MQDILINVGYDDISKLNLSDYNIEPEWNLIGKTNITTLLGNNLGTFKSNTVDFFYNKNVNFIYPIILFDEKLFENFITIELSNQLIKSIRNKKCRIVFVYILEGYFSDNGISWLNGLLEKYKFDKTDIILITSNLIDFKDPNFTLFKYNYFGNHFQFLEFSKLDKLSVLKFNNSYHKFLNHSNKLHFLCFNGLPRLNRVMMFNELNSNIKLKNKSIATLRGEDKNYHYDIIDWEKQKLSSGAHLNKGAHLDCFLNIVTETLFKNKSIFLTEKTYKPIYMCQPFIIFGNPYSIKKLKDLGYKTFDKWWDESYDDEINMDERFKKIITVLELISEWDMDKCVEIKKEMEEVLIHNYLNMFKTDEIYNILSILKCDNKPKNSLI